MLNLLWSLRNDNFQSHESMSREVIGFKPSLWGLSIDFVELMHRLGAKRHQNPVAIVAQRFLEIFVAHGIAIPQIPRLLPQLSLDKLADETVLLSAMTDDILNKTAKLFGVRRAWFDGIDDKIYEYRSCYKDPDVFLDDLLTLSRDELGFSVRALHCSKRLDWLDGPGQLLALILVERIFDFDDREVYRYRVYQDQWDWGYDSCRIQLKAMVRFSFEYLRSPIPLYRVLQTDLEAIISGRQVPHNNLQGPLLTNPSFEDYALSPKESVRNKESTEIEEVLRYMSLHKMTGIAR